MMTVVSELVRLAGGLGVLGVTATVAERLPTAFHEAGHATVADHVAETGVNTDKGWVGHFFGSRPLLRYATITPRVTEKGQYYLGETKLTVRWRDMSPHLRWSATTETTATEASTSDLPPTLECSSVVAECPAILPSLARIAYLFGGHCAEQRLYAAPYWWCGPSWSVWTHLPIGERLSRLIANPATATGDLRKAQQVARAALPTDAPADAPPALAVKAAFEFADAIVASRWAAVCALSGALMVRGTVDGAQHEELMRQHRCALSGATDESACTHSRQPSTAPSGGPRHPLDLALDLAAPYPFTFGVLWGLFLCPALDPALAPKHAVRVR